MASTPKRVRSPSHVSHTTKISGFKSILSIEQLENLLVIPPDGGWGWVITATAFIGNFVVDGVFYCFGIFLNDIGASLKVPPTKVALASPILTGFFYILGPLVCAIINRYGFRVAGVVGGCIGACAFIAAAFLEDIWVFLVVLGTFGGCGGSLIYIGSVIAVGFYFARWRALAMAAAASGTSVGMIAFPVMMTDFIKHLDWRTKFHIIGGMFGFCGLCAISWIPVQPTIEIPEEEEKKVTFHDHEVFEIEQSPSQSEDDDSETRLLNLYKFFRRFQNIIFPTVADEGKSIVTFDVKSIRDGHSFLAMNTRPSMASATVRSFFSGGRSVTFVDDEDEDESKCKRCCRICCCAYCVACGTVNYNRPLYRDDIFFPGSLTTLPQYSKSVHVTTKKIPVTYHKAVTRVATTVDLAESTRCVCCPEALVRGLATMLSFHLLKSISFFVMLLSGFLTALGMYSPYIFVIQRAIDMKIEERWAVLLLSIIGIANIIGRFLCGAVSFSPKIDSLVVSYLSLIFCGLASIASCYTPTLEGQIAFAVLFGVNIASLPVLRAIVIVDVFGLEHLTNGFGLNMLFQGFACFLGVPISGYLYDITGEYNASFAFSGCAILLSGLLLIPIKKIAKWEEIHVRR